MKRFLLRLWSIVRKIIFAALIGIICFIILSMAQGRHPTFFGYQVLRVLTSSMQPAISANTVIITKEVAEEDLEVGDIITFISEDDEIYGYYNTHRIYEILEEDGETKYVTKGDANPLPDENLVSYSQVTGIYIGELPGGVLIGKIFLLLSNNKVYFLVIMLPLALVLLSYIWQIIGYVTHRYDDEEDDDDEEVADEEDDAGDEDEDDGEVSAGNWHLTEEELDDAVDAIMKKQSK